MANSGKQSPLGINVLGSLLNSTGLTINPVAASYMGASKTNTSYTFGSVVKNTSLRMLTWAINDGFTRGFMSDATYDNLISIGASTIPTLGNAKPPTYVAVDPAGVWSNTAVAFGIQQGYGSALPGPATSGYGIKDNTGQGQQATWIPYNTTNPNKAVTQWGFTRCMALQAWNEFNWNGSSTTLSNPEYKEFCSSFSTVDAFVRSSNQAVVASDNSDTFLEGAYSNMNDLISADIAGVSLASVDFGNDLINLGKSLNLQNIASFGLPSNLLTTLGKSYAVTQDLSLALLASGLSTTDIAAITSGTAPNISVELEQQIYGAFLIITGENLAGILAPLQCKTQGLDSLADLLNVQKMFPISYASLTVPVYNADPGPTNSKTYYLIYQDGGLNSALNDPSIQDYVGTLLPNGTPPIYNDTVDPANYAELPKGFDSYLQNIIPADQATAAGAFSFTMRQIRNIERCDFQKFAKVVKGIENTSDLPLVAGTDKPTDQEATDFIVYVGALGSGAVGTYTMSDFFGCMSGLPYPWRLIQQRIQQLETSNLYNIYKELFLATSWEQATASVQYTTYVIGPTTYYHVTGVTLTDAGGGYGRGGAVAPIVTMTGGSCTTIIGTDDADTGSNNTGTFGRVTALNFTAGADITSVPTISIAAPAGGGWPSMNAVVQGYIDQANAEIAAIKSNNPDIAQYLIAYWNLCGTQLAREQRSRYTIMPPVTVPKDLFLNLYPSTLYNFTDNVPTLAKDTKPHMSAQTIEAICDLNTLGGQSLVAMMRQERNQDRLQSLGIDLDNNIPDQLTDSEVKTLTTNGTIAGAVDGILSPNGLEYTPPAWFSNIQDGEIITPYPLGTYVPAEMLDANNELIMPANPGFEFGSDTIPGDITPILEGSSNPVVNSLVPTGPVIGTPAGNFDPNTGTINNEIIIIAPPAEYSPSNLPPNLDPNYTSSTLMPATPDVQKAIDQVTICNCDCWVG